MRTEIIAYIKQLQLKNFTVTEELPFSNSGTELYLKNQKKIYVDVNQIAVSAFIPIMNGADIDHEVHTIKVYFSTDAKQLPPDYSQVVSLIRLAKDTIQFEHGFKKDAQSYTEYKNDLLITTIEFTFDKLI